MEQAAAAEQSDVQGRTMRGSWRWAVEHERWTLTCLSLFFARFARCCRQYVPSASASSAAASCDLLVLACGMMSSCYLSSLLSSQSTMQQMGRFEYEQSPQSQAQTQPTTKARIAPSVQQQPPTLLLMRDASDASTVFALNYLRPTAEQYFELTQQLLERLQPKASANDQPHRARPCLRVCSPFSSSLLVAVTVCLPI